ncbi:PAS domain S-box protein [Paraglaciecola aquimarina]|uniref:histidine kinase n=1 Tax=Paraglaciecola aquimarina TaxID=1235557 RepID=A0ABU3T2A3_9ALTE|nr:PAS domain S-box protein [Paraglaciecola aquimarina]MDU0356389.1 PAS domain S-box protein [Paraglaciecola aquimarina]
MPDVVTKKHHQHLSEYFTQPENRLMAQNRPNLYGKHKDKNLIPIEISLSSSTISDVKFATATIRDISARLETEKELKESITKAKQSYEQLKQMQVTLGETRMTNIMLEKLPLGTVLYTSEGKLIIANDRLLADTNYSRSELNSIKFEDFIEFENTEDQIIFAKITSAKASKINRSLTMLAKIKPQYDQMFPVELHISTYAYNEQFFWLITYTNLTDVMLVQNRLMQSHEQLARAVSATEDGIWEWNIVEDKVNFSPKFMQLIGKSNEAYPEYKHWFEHIHPDFRAKVDKAIATHFATHSLYEVEYLGLNENGEYNWFISIGNSLFNEQNKPVLMSGSIRNIHKSKMLEIEAAEKSEFLNTIYEGSSHAIWVLNVEANNEFRFLVFNPTACRTIGVTESAIKNKTISEITPAIFTTEAAEKYRNHYSICASKATHLSYVESIEINHEINWFRTDLYPIIDSSNKVTKIIGTAVNITEQKNVEIELENNKTFLEKIINSTICGLYLYDLKENKNTTFNARYTEILGYKIEELNQATDLEQFYHPADRDKMRQHMAKVTSATSNQVFSVKMRIKHKDGHWVWCYSFDSIVKFDKNGAPELMLGTFVDITEQTLLLEKLQDSNQYLENFAFIASHDLQEPLRKITAFSNSLSQRLEQQRANDEHIEFEFSRLVSASERMRNMIKDLLKLSRINSSELEISPVSLDIILKESIDLLSHLIEEQQAHIETLNTDYILNVDKGLFVQLFQNLIANSIKFKNKNNNPFINISLVNGLEDIEIIFTDNGIGVANKFTEQIFEPFRRLHSKERYLGSGIGLALCRQILSIHRGTITCMNDVTEGCEFRIILPKINIKGL